MAERKTVESRIPARLDRLPFSRWHVMIIFALGVTWILDGLEVTIIGSIASVLEEPGSGLNLTAGQVGLANGLGYIGGACTGSLFFSYLTDRYGRKRLFMITLGVYLVFTILTGFSWNFASFFVFRFLTGMGIGGEYSAIYSAIDELIPARIRGTVAMGISGSYWIGGALGAALSIPLLNPNVIDQAYGWRVAFVFGAVLGLGVLFVRRHVPESPRWLMTHGRNEEAEDNVEEIEEDVKRDKHLDELPEPDEDTITVEERHSIGFEPIFRAMFKLYPKRTVLGLCLMGSQAFLYNAVFFTYALVLTGFFGVENQNVGLYLIIFAAANLLGPLTLGRLFDSVGRVPMISGCYTVSGVLLVVTGFLFDQGVLNAATQTALFSVVFFFASASASAAYLTVSEVFPMEIRAMAIAVFYAVATALGGITGPIIFGSLIGTGSTTNLFIGYLIAAAVMIGAAIVELVLGVRAEQRSLESVASPLTAVEQTGS